METTVLLLPSLLGLLSSFYLALSFSNSDKKSQKDSISPLTELRPPESRSLSRYLFIPPVDLAALGKSHTRDAFFTGHLEADPPASVTPWTWVIPLFLLVFYYNYIFLVKPHSAFEFGLTLHIIFSLISSLSCLFNLAFHTSSKWLQIWMKRIFS